MPKHPRLRAVKRRIYRLRRQVYASNLRFLGLRQIYGAHPDRFSPTVEQARDKAHDQVLP